jgi:pectate lyase
MKCHRGIPALCGALLSVSGLLAAAAVPVQPVGYASLNGGTTGGEDGEVITVTDFASLVDAVSGSAPRVVQVSGTISSDGTRMIKVGSNKTIVGLGSDAVIRGFGFDVSGWTGEVVDQHGGDCEPEHIDEFDHVENVIVRNLAFISSSDDSINVRCYSHNVWIDHNTFFESKDGSVDIKRGSDWVTVSWNHFVGTDKTMILGHDDGNVEQDAGRLHVTYHHNWFEDTVQRHPRVRFGHAHVFNNYVQRPGSYFVGAGVQSHILVEANYVLSDKDKIKIIKDYGGDDATFTENNIVEMIPSADEYVLEVNNGRSFNAVSHYPYSLDAATELPTSVPAGAGAGKL